MSHKGNFWDNSVAESFFGTLKTELVHQENLQPERRQSKQYLDILKFSIIVKELTQLMIIYHQTSMKPL
ncbi:MAG TPA: hypothetical protein DCS66_04865 [Flavobacteriaceae bacterium]|nr:hypothetical protein [Flavobacteriaceae bacterium]|tara:strand:+ start:301 stop:507 length:207 start_codon:yes stop_codon:yes gene_type:complete